GVRNVPLLYALHDVQKSLRKEKGIETVDTQTAKGNVFSYNSPVDAVTNDWTNPRIRPHIRWYPVLSCTGVVSEIWHGDKWQRTMDRHALSPMVDAGEQHYYIDEPARICGGDLVIPIRWLEDEGGKIWFEAWKVSRDDSENVSSKTVRI
ncbi:hypothetical protein FA15DRAFT_602164, partial [Coprinopsis marcescibilis]